MATTWNPSDKSTPLSLSGGDLVATDTSAGIGAVRSTTALAGKTYYEISFVGGLLQAIGVSNLANAVADYTSALYLSGNDAGIYYNTTLLGDAGTSFDGGDIVSIAVDRPNALIWFRINGGNWNGSASADPATGAEGVDFSPYYAGGDSLRIWYFTYTNADAATLNAGASAFAYSVPSGLRAPDAQMSAAMVAFAETGVAASLRAGWRIGASAGGFSLAGQDAALTKSAIGAYVLTGEAPAFGLTGEAAGLVAGRMLSASAGAVVLSGQNAAVKAGRLASAAASSVALGAPTTELRIGRPLAAASASFALTGQGALFARTFGVAAEAAGFALAGMPGGLSYSGYQIWAPAAPATGAWTAAPGASGGWTPAPASPGAWS